MSNKSLTLEQTLKFETKLTGSSIGNLRKRYNKFEHDLRHMEQQSRNLKDFYIELGEEHHRKLSGLAKRHTRHLIPPQHNTKVNSKLFVEVHSADRSSYKNGDLVHPRFAF